MAKKRKKLKKKLTKKSKREPKTKKKVSKKKAVKRQKTKTKKKAVKRQKTKKKAVKRQKRRRVAKVYKAKSKKSTRVVRRKPKRVQKKRAVTKVRKRARKKRPETTIIPPPIIEKEPVIIEEDIEPDRISTIPPAPVVTEEEIAEPRIVPIRIPVESTRVPIYDIESGEEKMFSEEGIPESSEHYMNSSNASKKEMSGVTIGGVERVADIFEKAFERSLAKGPFESDEVNIFRHGVIIRPRNGGEPSEAIKEKLGEMLQDVPGAAVHITDEHGTFSIRIGVGSPTEAANAEQASDNLRKHAEKFNDIFDYISGWYDDVDWFSFWDTDEAMY